MRLDAAEASDSKITSWVTVLCNRSDVTHMCYLADDKEGWVGVYFVTAVSPSGGLAILADENGKPVSTIVKGKVEIILKPDAPEAARLEFERRKLGVIP